ncbi:uncharacterized protein F5Z01DRAFT_684937 [Emericellopsis atlantica]|uniref:Zn(2)-C6 fungal-type domain-containing protein n=1 Tax=Emericellopsis atlantica TaxID=2614577 RepID=A0A9P7ZW95_9HYPO|nr:uncharacterized protein F5Z01DRAFT_684937 [Emericellopsis atlantica]KAG9258937.1 hypothetical protein F5Z01DRAFT_684937 [Emericellopsis atlantica]
MSGRGRTTHSKGCITCKKRKVKCDERLPKCLRCENSKRECLGYSKSLVFISSTDNETLSRTSSPSSCKAIERVKESQRHLPLYVDASVSMGDMLDTTIDSSISLDAFQEDMFISHLLAKLYRPTSNTVPQGSDDTSLIDVLRHDNRRSAAHAAMLSVGQAFFGRVHGLGHMVSQSRSHYVKALHRIQDELATSSHPARGSMQWLTGLWCCSFLGMYEMICSSSPTAWIQHSRGLAAMAVGCIAQRKRTFLERHDWQTTPWATSPAPKSTWIRLQDIMCRIPGLMEDADSLVAGDEGAPNLAHLQGKILENLDECDHLQALWHQEHPEARRSVSPREPESPFTCVYAFQTFDQAAEAIHFDVVTLLLYGLAEKTGLDLRHTSPRSHFLALRICRSIEYMVASSKHDSLGAMVVIFPLRVAARHVAACPAVADWLGRQWRRLAGQKGFDISSRVMEITNGV